MKIELFQPSIESEARILLIIDIFTGTNKSVEGRMKLAKLDFLLRYPEYLARILLEYRNIKFEDLASEIIFERTIESQMVRYKYGPWDPSHYAIIGRLTGKGLITFSESGYRSTSEGHKVSGMIQSEEIWEDTVVILKLLKKHLNLSGNNLKELIYKYIPEVTQANWGDSL
ncbi:hypothetical protein [Leptospira licerasiae]|uniref:DUF2513 domain-containing protein n=1 Tax=Leptospira licerasiae str. MMD4847 TaxID=1049971 RepID=A0ABP2RK48_9LEPT|nr:hypothetical protein [Leptospira licerasiae]EIE01035.1 hypothetical protein LEP1GSC185_3854 [Leptospira licerasiae serovar Varillal str. VAR 010]EJZ43907.1 hypothetical protein LEP1GSC178_2036 [Leptospira licerasiae str. MMD4847]